MAECGSLGQLKVGSPATQECRCGVLKAASDSREEEGWVPLDTWLRPHRGPFGARHTVHVAQTAETLFPPDNTLCPTAPGGGMTGCMNTHALLSLGTQAVWGRGWGEPCARLPGFKSRLCPFFCGLSELDRRCLRSQPVTTLPSSHSRCETPTSPGFQSAPARQAPGTSLLSPPSVSSGGQNHSGLNRTKMPPL